jgi:hypothetical protein
LPGTPVRARRRVSAVPRPSTLRADPSLLLQVLTAPGELRLTLDNGLIYPPPPSNALYHLPRVLTWSGNEIFLFRSLPATTRSRNVQPPRDLALYTMRRTPFMQEITLIPRREGLKAAIMRGRRSFLDGKVWEVEVRNEITLRYAKGKWKNPNGETLAEETDIQGQRAVLTIVGPNLEVNMKDLIVASWTSRLWQGNGRLGLTKSLMRSENGWRGPRPPVLLHWRAFRDR